MADLMIMAPWLTHFSITFFFSGSVGVSFGPPGISTCVFVRKMVIIANKYHEVNLVDVDNLLVGLIDRVAIVDQHRHCARRVDIS